MGNNRIDVRADVAAPELILRTPLPLKRSLIEAARSTKHNLLHLKRLKFSYAGRDTWAIRHDRGRMKVSTYPYLACHDIEGYLKNGEWSIEPGQTVIDAGGCFGEFTMYASQCVGPGGRVLMMEPDAANITVAQRNFVLNGSPENITIVPAGLWHERGTIRFATGHDAQSSMVSDAATGGGANMIEVPTITFNDLAADYRLKPDRLFQNGHRRRGTGSAFGAEEPARATAAQTTRHRQLPPARRPDDSRALRGNPQAARLHGFDRQRTPPHHLASR